MANRYYDFRCESGHIFEAFVDSEVRKMQCKHCSLTAERIVSKPAISLEGWSGSFPGAANRFEKRHTDKLKAELKAKS